MKRILVHSGGGVKGYASMQQLVKMENTYGDLSQHFDLMCGSSVGAINLAFLASGKMSAKDMEEMYPDMIRYIFYKQPGFPKYDRNHFFRVWDSHIGADFLMKDCVTKLQITAVNLMTQRNHFFKSWEKKDGQERLVDVVMRSFAAPVYFGTLVDEYNKTVWADGGMGASNLPIDQARIEAMHFLKWDKFDMVALGTGYVDESVSFEDAKGFRTLRQLGRYFDLKDGGLARAQSPFEQVKRMQSIAKANKGINFKYIDVEIPSKIDKLDGIRYLKQYKEYGLKMREIVVK